MPQWNEEPTMPEAFWGYKPPDLSDSSDLSDLSDQCRMSFLFRRRDDFSKDY
jgi:hypothetical protein